MPRYYFDLRDGEELAIDEEGLELSNLRAVQLEAARALADLARETLQDTISGGHHYMAIQVRDDIGPVMQVRFTFEVETVGHG
jgi:hypothetical protein